MAVDNTPPRLKLIVTIAVITVITLIAINFVTENYYAMMTDAAQREKIAPTRDKDEQRKAEALAFTNAAMPIEKAMGDLGKGERSPLIAPTQSDDLGAMTGWTKLPKPAPVPAPRPAPTPEATDAGGAAATDGGAQLATDGGAATPMAADAGPMHNAAGADAGAHH